MIVPKLEMSGNFLLFESAFGIRYEGALEEPMKKLWRNGHPVRAAKIADMYERGSERVHARSSRTMVQK